MGERAEVSSSVGRRVRLKAEAHDGSDVYGYVMEENVRSMGGHIRDYFILFDKAGAPLCYDKDRVDVLPDPPVPIEELRERSWWYKEPSAWPPAVRSFWTLMAVGAERHVAGAELMRAVNESPCPKWACQPEEQWPSDVRWAYWIARRATTPVMAARLTAFETWLSEYREVGSGSSDQQSPLSTERHAFEGRNRE